MSKFIMNWANRENLLIGMIAMLSIVDIILLSTDSYFSLNKLTGVYFGLQGAVINNQRVNYSELIGNCTLAHYCYLLPAFKQSGQILQALLIIDVLLLVAVIFMNITLPIILKRAIRKNQPMSRKQKCGLRTLACGKNLLFLHPGLINLGFMLWILNSKLNDLSNEIELHEGLIMMIIQSFLSWLCVAFTVWLISSIKRRNLRMLKTSGNYKGDLSISI